MIQATRRIADPVWDAPQPALLCQIFGDCAHEGVEPAVACQFRLPLDRSVAISVGSRQIESIDELSQHNVPWRASLNRFNRLSEGIWAHRPLPCDSCSSAELLLLWTSRALREVSTEQSYRILCR